MNTKQIKIDAKNQILGRLSTKIAATLMGKNDPNFTYNNLTGDKVLVYNVEKIRVTGSKQTEKKYYRHSGYLGNLKSISYDKLQEKDPKRILFLSVKNMLPKNRLQKQWLKRLTLVTGDINGDK